MTFAEEIIYLAGSEVKASRQIGRARVFECRAEPELTRTRVTQFIGDVTPTPMRTTHGDMAVVRIGQDFICWKEENETGGAYA